jgi:(p)ppGpp synthase/HD superfamily hydrolase
LVSETNQHIQARDFSIQQHGDQQYGSLPYIVHLQAVVSVLLRFGVHPNNPEDTALLSAAWLHDVIEDTETTKEEVEVLFGKEIATIVFCVTDGKGTSRSERKKEVYQKIIANQKAIQVKLADRIANVEACFLNGHKKFKMYQIEHPAFIDAITPHTHTSLGKSLMEYLNTLIHFK